MENKSYSTVGRPAYGPPKGLLTRFANLWTAFAFVVMLSTSAAFAQEAAVTGKVTDGAGSIGLPGVTVQVKGQTRGTNTDVDGKYRITNVGSGATLVFSSIGYVTQEVAVGNRQTVDVALAEDNKTLSEVVVVGYGSQRQKDVTGSVESIGAKDFNKGVISSPEQLLQGRVAGVQITPSSGEPGAPINIQIRGTSSLRGGNNPLFVVDGVPLDNGTPSNGDPNNSAGGTPDFGGGSSAARNPLAFLNPADIENISVLKDASAAAIYGSRGANGVVLITTRKGRAGSNSLSFSASTAFSGALKRYNVLDAPAFLSGVQAAGGDISGAVNQKSNTNWQDQILRNSVSQIYNIGFGGGTQDTRYYLSLGYQDQQGIVRNSSQQRITGRINASHELFNDKVIIDLNATTSGLNDRYILNGDNAGFQGNLIGAAIQANPTYPVTNADGSFFQPGGDFRNPAAVLAYNNDRGTTNRTLANASVTWKIIDGLSAKANFGIDNSSSNRQTSLDSRLNGQFNLAIIPGLANVNIFRDNTTGLGGAAYIQNTARTSRLVEYTLNYNRKLGPGSLDALAGFSYQIFQNKGSYVAAGNFPFDESQISYVDNIGAANANNRTSFGGGSSRSQNELQSYFGRVNYNINDKYLVTGTLRVDGSSRFGINNKYGAFPSVAVAWRLSQENFVPKNVFDDLKLRVNYGVTGNQDFAGGASKIIFNYNSNGSTTQLNNPNPNLKWEQNETIGAGIDFSLLKGRLGGSVDYFHKSVSNTLFQVFYAQPAPVNFQWVNLPGQIINAGVELNLNYQAVQSQKLTWEVLYNMTFLNNTVRNFGTTVPTGGINGQGLSGAYAQTIQDGYPIFSFILPTFTGFDSNGFATYADNGASTIHGSPLPKMRLGLTNNFTFGRWNASLFFNGQFGGFIYNNTANALFLKGALKNGRNVLTDVASSPENGLNSGAVSTRFLEKSDFVRLTNASIGYSFNLPQGGFAKTLGVSVAGQNLLLFTGYTGLNPDVNTVKYYNNIPSLGIDYTPYPTARTVTVGLNVGF
ncbi:SusC/RagA family TonB-linked outer membrane protein [Fibrella aquatilis]|uniref:SusC/RagA family TonB-linked outer membrane protein n=1 Tax=Fibrella aquatilis TaxID=2817059 RepID=A0A939G5R4_9BACT|nr:SusC/RagA family TonB-linked outer membrane protein [Fibrella aquatilis]MBO0931124.1 SusC/RagA family TonB-linked outer membrane protein [Fibrella aquatilis]